MESVSSSSSEHDAFSENLVDDKDKYEAYMYKKSGKKQKAKRCIFCCLTIVLFVMAVQVVFVPNMLRKKMSDGLKDALVITSNKSAGYDFMQSNADRSDTGAYLETRFFNVTNVYDIISKGAFPQLKITAPIVYTQYSILYNVSFSEDKEWWAYNGWYYNILNKGRNRLDPSAIITIFSPILGGIYYSQQWGTNIFRNIKIYELSKELKHVNVSELLFWRGTPREILFEMYRINISSPNISINIEIDWGLAGNNGSNWNDSEKTQSETFTVFNTGNSKMAKINEVKFFGILTDYVECWALPIPVAPAHLFMWGMNKVTKNADQPLINLTPLLFSSYKYEFNHSYSWKYNFELYRHTIQLSPQLDNFTNYPPNAAYYAFKYNAVTNLTKCYDGVPFFVSMPYFLGADQALIDDLTKMNLRSPSWHDLPYIDVEPVTGIIFRENRSFQVNTLIHSIDWIANDTEFAEGYYNIPDDIVVPMFITSLCIEMIDSDLKGLKGLFNVFTYADILEISGYVSLAVVSTSLVILFTLLYYKFITLPKFKICKEIQ